MQAHIKAFEKELKCPICFEYVDDAVTPPCHHLFCRKCIVHAIERKSTCPVCGVSIQRGQRSLEAQPWTNDVVNQYRLTLQEVFRDRETDFLFSQVPMGGFAAFKPPVLSPNRTTFIPAGTPQPSGIVSIPPPPVQAKSLGGKKQLGVRCRAPTARAAATTATASPFLEIEVPAKCNTERNLIGDVAPLGQKREREADVKQVTFAAVERPRAQPSRLLSAAATVSLASSIHPKSYSRDSLVNSESALLPLPPSSISAAATIKAPLPPPSFTEHSKRTYGRTPRQSAAPLDPPAAISSTVISRSSPALDSPAKAAADDQSRALNNTPGKDHQSAALASAAITPNTEPRSSRGRTSGAPHHRTRPHRSSVSWYSLQF